MNPRKDILHILLLSLAALPAVSWGAPFSSTARNSENSGNSSNCTQQANSLYELLSRYLLDVKANVTFRVQSEGELLRQFKETAKEASDFSVSGAMERRAEERRECAQIRDFSTVVSGRSLCSWRYQCDFDPKRVPASIFTAEIQSGNTIHTVVGHPQQYQCKPIYMPLNVLRLNCSKMGKAPEWVLVREKVTVGFTAVAIA